MYKNIIRSSNYDFEAYKKNEKYNLNIQPIMRYSRTRNVLNVLRNVLFEIKNLFYQYQSNLVVVAHLLKFLLNYMFLLFISSLFYFALYSFINIHQLSINAMEKGYMRQHIKSNSIKPQSYERIKKLQ